MDESYDPLEGIKSLRKQLDREKVNCRWLLGHMDTIHKALCPGRSGTWQDRTLQAVEAAEKIRRK